ncbi:putative host specificity protein, partial [Escherichia coli PA49]
DSRQYQYQTGP